MSYLHFCDIHTDDDDLLSLVFDHDNLVDSFYMLVKCKVSH